MLYAGKVMALAMIELMTKPDRLKATKEEFEQVIKKTPVFAPLQTVSDPSRRQIFPQRRLLLWGIFATTIAAM